VNAAFIGRMRELPHTHSCFVCGESNAIGLRLRFETDGRLIHCRFRPRIEHAGFQGVVHGGLIATVLDEIMVWACAVGTGRFAFSVEMNVRYVNPLPPGEEAMITGELTANRRNKVFETKAEARRLSGEMVASATGKYFPIKETMLPAMLADVTGGPHTSVTEMLKGFSPAIKA